MKKDESNGLVNKTLILKAYTFLREKECTIPSETLDFMRIASLEKLESLQSNTPSVSKEYLPTEIISDKEIMNKAHEIAKGLHDISEIIGVGNSEVFIQGKLFEWLYDKAKSNTPSGVQSKEQKTSEGNKAEIDKFHHILLKHGIYNRAFFTSNEFHTIWDAVKEYRSQGIPTITDEDLVNESFSWESIYEDGRKRELADKAVLDVVRSKVSKVAFRDIERSMEFTERTYDYEITDHPEGKFQDEDEFEELQGQWVNQTLNGGYSGDDFAGTISIQISQNEYFQFSYTS